MHLYFNCAQSRRVLNLTKHICFYFFHCSIRIIIHIVSHYSYSASGFGRSYWTLSSVEGWRREYHIAVIGTRTYIIMILCSCSSSKRKCDVCQYRHVQADGIPETIRTERSAVKCALPSTQEVYVAHACARDVTDV